MNKSKRVLALMLSLVILAAAFAGCKTGGSNKKPEKNEKNEVVESGEVAKERVEDFTAEVQEKTELNEDTVGWLSVPGTTINDVVVQGEDNDFYHRRNFEKIEEYNGVYYADRRADFGDGARANLPANNTIYGHSLTDNPESANYEVKLAPLHKLRNIEFAEEHLYIQYSTAEGNFLYEIVSIYVANSDNPDNPYNKGDLAGPEYATLVKEELLPRSLYDYGVEIKEDDKFITLSTCIYVLEDGTQTNYPKTYYRYAVTARLVGEDEPVLDHKTLTKQEDRIIDPDGKWQTDAAA